MTLDMLNYTVAWPEIFLLAMTCLVLVVDVYLKDENRNVSYVLAQFGLIITLLFLLMTDSTERVIAFLCYFFNAAMAGPSNLFFFSLLSIFFFFFLLFLFIYFFFFFFF